MEPTSDRAGEVEPTSDMAGRWSPPPSNHCAWCVDKFVGGGGGGGGGKLRNIYTDDALK